MRIETIKKNIYNYEDIMKDDALKNKCIEYFRENNNDYDFISQDILQDYKTNLEFLGYNEVNIYYSGFWSQGDGACFTCESVDVQNIINRIGIKIRLGLSDELLNTLSVSIKHNGRYYHEKSTQVYYDSYFRTVGEKTEAYLLNIVEKITDFIENERYNLSKEIYKTLEDTYEGMQSDASILEIIKSENLEFYDNGRIVY